MKIKQIACLMLFIAGLALFYCLESGSSIVRVLVARASPAATVADRISRYGAVARKRWQPFFEQAQISYPPRTFTLVGLKAEKILELYASDGSKTKFIRSIPICAASGGAGPKLREGDGQVPEGVYKITFLNPNSSYHLSLRLNYPNAFDRLKGREEGRQNLGGDIMIHGNCVSIGCIAIEDQPIEDLFVLAADVGIEHIKVVLAPYDFRKRVPQQTELDGLPVWIPGVYSTIRSELAMLGNPGD